MATVGELRDLFREELRARLAPAGWKLIESDNRSSFGLAAFVLPLGGDFAATAEVGCSVRIPDRPPVSVANVEVGVSYEPLRRLWPLLGDRFRVSLLFRDVHEPMYLDEDDDGPDEPIDDELWKVDIATAGEAARAAEDVAGAVLEHAIPFAEQYTDLNVLLAEFGIDDEDESCDERLPAMLAAAGRFDEARSALGRLPRERGLPQLTEDTMRFAYQLERWIDSGGDLTLIPDQPPPPRFERHDMPSFSEMWSSARGRDDAVKAVRAVRDGKDRDQLRELLATELSQRNLTESPRWIESKLDDLTASRAQQTERTVDGLKTLGRMGLGAMRAIRDRQLPNLDPPEWLEPPDRAAFALPRQTRASWTAVQLGPDTDDLLSRIHACLPTLAGITTNFKAWLAPASADSPGQISVHIGEHRVGVLDQQAIQRFTPIMDAAANRDELPRIEARLTPRPATFPYLLELQLPAQPDKQ